MTTTIYQELTTEVTEFQKAVEEADINTDNIELACQWANYFQGTSYKLAQLMEKCQLENDVEMNDILSQSELLYQQFNDKYNQLSE